MEVRMLQKHELAEALQLVWRVFLEFEAPEYSEQGIQTFREFIEYENIAPFMASGERQFWCCEEDGKLVGVCATRNENHICLLFVDKEYHRRGIARKLFEAAAQGKKTMTVNSSPYAVEAYRRLGFKPTDTEQLENGLRYTPMRCTDM